MNEEELRSRLHAAVGDIKPRNRFDDLMVRRQDGRHRGLSVLAVAAVVLVALAIVAIVNRGHAPQSVITINPDQTTTSAPGPDGRIGKQITISESSLPVGVHLLDELPRRTEADQTIVARYAEDDRIWNADGPYLRIVVDRGDGIGTTWQSINRGQPDYQVSGQAAYLTTDAATDPATTRPPGNLSELDNAWVTLEWSTGPNELVRIQAKGIEIDTLRAIADTVRITE